MVNHLQQLAELVQLDVEVDHRVVQRLRFDH
jgi:hypothetical protein